MSSDETFVGALAELERVQRVEKSISGRPKRLLVTAIKTAPTVFQPRLLFGNDVDEYHVRELVRALSAQAGNDLLEPIVVMQIGQHPFCVDGHHRLAAYKEARVTSPVPVEWFEGSIRKGSQEAVRRNSKDKLPMSRAAKLEAAWRMVVLGEGSKELISSVTTVPKSTIGNMRRKLRELKDGYVQDPDVSAVGDGEGFQCSLTWAEAKAHGGGTEGGEAWEENLVNEWARRLGDAFGREWGKQPQLAARAIQRYSERMPELLLEAWQEDGVLDGPNPEETDF